MGEFSRNINLEPMRVQRRVASVQAVIRGLVQTSEIEPEMPAKALDEGQQLVLDIRPSGAGFDLDGNYTTGRL